ncbi:type II toxin-antitoxin system VapC family toxin [Allochromatium tepidum]|uniref:Ribonuclease VapC n=1 Tax=Allochromatium tepidum TaxID=553982 RepID=A0ABM7QNR4_9GAMM|nr:type II toxin-antitoxin system VapC family toxin [Allochromatium tepidum]BCU07504.1 ribonuclease VapC [Allochromatium tepidum]
MHYVDTSVLIAYLVPEKYSVLADLSLRDPAHRPLALSAWTETELVSALGIKCRTEQVEESDRRKALEQYERLRDHFVHLPVLHDDYLSAARLLQDWRLGLRAGDALHLAIAHRHSCITLSLDERLVKAGRQAGIAALCLRSEDPEEEL